MKRFEVSVAGADEQDAVPRHGEEGGWIFRELLGLGEEGPIDLPAVTLTLAPSPTTTP